MTEDEMVGWHRGLDGHKLEQVLGVDDSVQPSLPLSLLSPPALSISQNQGLFQ